MNPRYYARCGIGLKITPSELQTFNEVLEFDETDDDSFDLRNYIEDDINTFPSGFKIVDYGICKSGYNGLLILADVNEDEILQGTTSYPDFSKVVEWLDTHNFKLQDTTPKLQKEFWVFGV